jgi:hypothetical protein
LTDGHKNIIMNVHKIILYCSCSYFEKLLTNFKEEKSNNITVNVSNVYVAYDMIMSFYNKKTNLGKLSKIEHLLETLKCHDFFGKSFFPKGKEDLDNTPRSEGFGFEIDCMLLNNTREIFRVISRCD